MSAKIENLIKLMDSAFEMENYDEVYSFSIKILEIDPDNVKAIYMKGISIAGKSKIANPHFKEMVKTIYSVWKRIPEKEIKTIAERIAGFAENYYSYYKNSYQKKIIENDEILIKTVECMHLEGLAFMLAPSEKYARNIVKMYGYLVNAEPNVMHSRTASAAGIYFNGKEALLMQMDYILEVVEEYLKSQTATYTSINMLETINVVVATTALLNEKAAAKRAARDKGSGGCFIATAVYGSYEAKEVIVLRRFRDKMLKKFFLGRLFIKIYYAVGPCMAEWLKGHRLLKNKIRMVLDEMVRLMRDRL